jgi:NADH-quinone oxidoreductase subunit D
MGRIGGFEEIGLQKHLELDVFLEEFPVAWKEFENFERNRILLIEL